LDDGRWVTTEMGQVWKPASKKRAGQTPHALLKHRCRNALTAFRQAHNLAVVLLPSYVGKATTAAGRDITLGKKGQADDTALIRFGSGYGVSVAIEYKAGTDRQSDHQKRFQERWEAAGGVYVLCRDPADLTQALTKLLGEHGAMF
jgi:hypothetical protein